MTLRNFLPSFSLLHIGYITFRLNVSKDLSRSTKPGTHLRIKVTKG